MLFSTLLGQLGIVSVITVAAASTPDVKAIFKNPVMSRVYQQTAYTLKGNDPWENNNVSIAQVASSLAALNPSYVSSTIRLAYNVNLTQEVIDNFNYIRNTVLKTSPDAKFDVELNLDPNDPGKGYPNGEAAVAQMKQLNTQLPIDGWWFDYLSTAQQNASSWVVDVADYAHSQNQTIGGNIFGTTDVPPNMDAIAFVDGRDANNTEFGYGIQADKVQALQRLADAKGALVLGHLNCNPQTNVDITESCVYMRNWTSTERSHYLNYWVEEAASLNFTYMLPLFFPLCPGATSYSPLADAIPDTNRTVYDHVKTVALSR